MLGDFGEVVVIDWGFGTELGRPERADAGQIVGTAAYMAPEQAAGASKGVGPRTDIYGLGAILYEILTDRPPLAGADNAELLRQARTETLPPPERIRRSVPATLVAVCKKALAREPSDHYLAARPAQLGTKIGKR